MIAGNAPNNLQHEYVLTPKEYHRLKALTDLVPGLVEALIWTLRHTDSVCSGMSTTDFLAIKGTHRATLAAAQKLIAKDKEES